MVMMSIVGSAQQSLLTNTLVPAAATTRTHIPRKRNFNSASFISCRHQSSDTTQQDSPTSTSGKIEKQLGKLAVVAVAAGLLTLGSVGDALAAKSGGRVGGQAFRPAAPRPSAPRPRTNNNSRTNIYINPPVAPPLGGYGYGYGWGWSPFSFFAPGPSVAVGVGGGFDTLTLFLFLGAAAAVVRSFTRPRNDDEDDDY